METITRWVTIVPGLTEWLVEITPEKVSFHRIGVITRSHEAPHPDLWYVTVPASESAPYMKTIAARSSTRLARKALKHYYENGSVEYS